MTLIDLRSDTVTRPVPAMLDAMMRAPVGDVVFGDDPTVKALEATVAERLGFEAGLFVPSGTMSNQLAIGAMAGPGDAVLIPELAHIARWEGSGAAASFGVQLIQVGDSDGSGLPRPEDFERHHYFSHVKAPRVVGISLENTHNWCGGQAFDAAAIAARTEWARSRSLHRHLDGARLFNAAVALGVDVRALTAGFSSVSLCLSKGLGAPVGSVLVGSRPFIARADRLRHRLGGAWRQAGILAAAGLYALEHHVERLADDHRRARALAEGLIKHRIGAPLHAVQTNIVQFEVDPRHGSALDLAARLQKEGITFFPTGATTGRLVTHLDVSDDAIQIIDTVWETL